MELETVKKMRVGAVVIEDLLPKGKIVTSLKDLDEALQITYARNCVLTYDRPLTPDYVTKLFQMAENRWTILQARRALTALSA